MHIAPFYAAVLALFYFVLSVRTLHLRRSLQIAIGDSGDQRMLRAMRVHSNFAEYVPLALLLVFMLELQGAHPWLLHALGICLVVGRISHAYGVSKTSEDYRFRVFGMTMTFSVLVGSAGYVLSRYAWYLVG